MPCMGAPFSPGEHDMDLPSTDERREAVWPGQWTARVQSPEGLLVGISYTPWMHSQ